MLRIGIGLVAAAVMPFLMAGALLTSSPNGASALPPAPAVDQLPEPPPESAVNGQKAAEDHDEEAAVDIMGNQVTSAVATYKFDATGSLYELHSPQTELPRLKPPKS